MVESNLDAAENGGDGKYKSLADDRHLLKMLQIAFVDCNEETSRLDLLKKCSTYFNSSQGQPYVFEKSIQGFRCFVVINSVKPKHVMYMFHTRSHSPKDFIDAAFKYAKAATKSLIGVTIVIPFAPCVIQGKTHDNREWWTHEVFPESELADAGGIKSIIKMKRKLIGTTAKPREGEDVDAGAYAPLTGLMEQLKELIQNVSSLLQTRDSRTSFCGFGQGSVVAKQLLFSGNTPPVCCTLLSTIDTANYPGHDVVWHTMTPNERVYRATPQVYMSHGMQDKIYPYKKAVSVYTMLTLMGFRVKFHKYNQGFETPPKVLSNAIDFWIDVLMEGRYARPPPEMQDRSDIIPMYSEGYLCAEDHSDGGWGAEMDNPAKWGWGVGTDDSPTNGRPSPRRTDTENSESFGNGNTPRKTLKSRIKSLQKSFSTPRDRPPKHLATPSPMDDNSSRYSRGNSRDMPAAKQLTINNPNPLQSDILNNPLQSVTHDFLGIPSIGQSVVLGAAQNYGTLTDTEIHFYDGKYDPMINIGGGPIGGQVESSLWNLSKFDVNVGFESVVSIPKAGQD